MSCINAVDSNVYVYALDADEAAKQAKALELSPIMRSTAEARRKPQMHVDGRG